MAICIFIHRYPCLPSKVFVWPCLTWSSSSIKFFVLHVNKQHLKLYFSYADRHTSWRWKGSICRRLLGYCPFYFILHRVRHPPLINGDHELYLYNDQPTSKFLCSLFYSTFMLMVMMSYIVPWPNCWKFCVVPYHI